MQSKWKLVKPANEFLKMFTSLFGVACLPQPGSGISLFLPLFLALATICYFRFFLRFYFNVIQLSLNDH